MRPLPRVLAFADDRVAALDDLGVRAAALAAAGPAVGLVARLPGGTADQLAALAQRFVALAAAPMASVFVTGRADAAHATRAHGVILRRDDLGVADVRKLRDPRSLASLGTGLATRDYSLLRSVHAMVEAEAAVADGADALIVGSIWPSRSHPDREASGTALLAQVVSLGRPTYAIGGVTAARAAEARDAGAWGVAAIGALWDAASPHEAAMEMTNPWR
jgi:thiamine-phosphate pyrophosphorylase